MLFRAVCPTAAIAKRAATACIAAHLFTPEMLRPNHTRVALRSHHIHGVKATRRIVAHLTLKKHKRNLAPQSLRFCRQSGNSHRGTRINCLVRLARKPCLRSSSLVPGVVCRLSRSLQCEQADGCFQQASGLLLSRAARAQDPLGRRAAAAAPPAGAQDAEAPGLALGPGGLCGLLQGGPHG